MKSVRKFKMVWALVLVAAVMLVGVPTAYADDNPVSRFFKKLFKYPVKTTENVGGATARGVENTGGVLQATGKNIGSTVTGEPENVDLGEPLHKAGAGTAQFVSEVAGAGLKAAEEVNAEVDGAASEAAAE